MIYMCIMDYSDDKELLEQVRPPHRKYLRDLMAVGKVLSAGSFLPKDDGGLFSLRSRIIRGSSDLTDINGDSTAPFDSMVDAVRSIA
jgi:uncharacterized protein YciI